MVQQVAAQLSDRITDDEDQILEGSAADYQDYSGDLDEDLPKGSVSFNHFYSKNIKGSKINRLWLVSYV